MKKPSTLVAKKVKFKTISIPVPIPHIKIES
jgi:hypothetical protein